MKQFFVSLVTTVILLAILLISAGRFDYWQAWAYAVISTIMNLCIRFILRNAPDVAKERTKSGEGAKGWDKALLIAGFLLTIITLVVAGLDSGRSRSWPQLSWRWFFIGVALTTTGSALFLTSLKENRFFSSVVRIQTDRGHTVCRTGPYSIIRHPGCHRSLQNVPPRVESKCTTLRGEVWIGFNGRRTSGNRGWRAERAWTVGA